MPDELWMEVRDIVQDTGIKTIPKKKKCKKAKWLSGETLQIAVKRREVKSKGEKVRYKHLKCRVPKKIQPVHSKGDQPWVFFGRNNAEAETPVFVHFMRRVDVLEKTDAGRDWGQEEEGTTEDEMAGWHHQLNEREFE